jgi:predicted TIM-barrel fold metal-dependent hydrolase
VEFAYPPESLVAEMDYAGVDRALLHRTPYMGLSNEYIADCVRRFPDRLQGLAYIEEWRIEPETETSIRKLERAIKELRLSGLQFLPFHRRLYGQEEKWDGPGFRPFWDAVAELKIPVFFTLGGDASLEAYLDKLRALRRWMERYPAVKVVHTHGFNWRLFADEETLHVPDVVYETAPIDHPNFYIQLLFAVFLQSRWDYPMPQMRPTLEKMVERIGARRLMWGTDIPVVLLHWTYRQSLDYIRRYCDFITQDEMDLILGGNMARFMGLEGG